MGGGGGGDSVTTIRYADYIEGKHSAFLSEVARRRALGVADNPYIGLEDLDIDLGFFGPGLAITTYGSLFAKYKAYIEDLDLDALYDKVFNRVVNSQNVKDLIIAEGIRLSDDIESNVYPRFMAGARDLNSVMSSTFVIGKNNLEHERIKALSKYGASLRFSLIGQAGEIWKFQAGWKNDSVQSYAKFLQLYYAGTLDYDSRNVEINAKKRIWPFTILDNERAALGALQGALTTNKDVEGPSKGAKALGGAMAGAAMGSTIGPMGAIVGGIIGGVAGMLSG